MNYSNFILKKIHHWGEGGDNGKKCKNDAKVDNNIIFPTF